MKRFRDKGLTQKTVFNALLVLVILAWFVFTAVRVDSFRVADLLFSRDQQATWHYHRENFLEAAKLFEDPLWKAAALYQAGQYQAAFDIWSSQGSDATLFNQANALSHLKEYSLALDYYWLVLQLQPQWQDAQFNFDLIKLLAKQANPVTAEQRPSPRLEADDVVFDEQAKQNQQPKKAISELGETSAESIWLRRLKSTPADFLRQKFRYQQAENE